MWSSSTGVHEYLQRGVWWSGDCGRQGRRLALLSPRQTCGSLLSNQGHCRASCAGCKRLSSARPVRKEWGNCEDERLKTCALRCAGIYGEGEQRHLPRIVSYIERGLFQFTYGSEDSLVEFLHGDNFVQAHVEAACALQEHNSPVAGEAYFISDGKPVNNFEFFRPLCEGLGYRYPELHLPLSLVFYTAFVIEVVHSIIGRYVYNFQPLITRAEVLKTGVTHYFSLEKARRDFGYDPQPHNLSGVVTWFRDRGKGRGLKGHSRKGVNNKTLCHSRWIYLLGFITLCVTVHSVVVKLFVAISENHV
ncbi:Short-chain dehydrogenase/reductase family 42E member 1, partial [Geodia barretti]